MSLRCLLAAALATAVVATPSLAQTSANSVADFQNWSVFEVDEPQQCFVANREAETEVTQDGTPTTANRGDPFLYVTYTPGQENAVVSVLLGFPPDRNRPPVIGISGQTFEMLPGDGGQREWAWVQPQDDKAVLDNMIAGTIAVVTSQSTTGKTIADSFSLLGFTDALNDARSRCAGG